MFCTKHLFICHRYSTGFDRQLFFVKFRHRNYKGFLLTQAIPIGSQGFRTLFVNVCTSQTTCGFTFIKHSCSKFFPSSFDIKTSSIEEQIHVFMRQRTSLTPPTPPPPPHQALTSKHYPLKSKFMFSWDNERHYPPPSSFDIKTSSRANSCFHETTNVITPPPPPPPTPPSSLDIITSSTLKITKKQRKTNGRLQAVVQLLGSFLWGFWFSALELAEPALALFGVVVGVFCCEWLDG